MAGDVKEIITSVVGALRANPAALAALCASFLVVIARRLGPDLHRQGRDRRDPG